MAAETPIFLGLDIGTSAIKVIAFDGRGRERGQARREYTLDKPGPQMLELDAEKYWHATVEALRELTGAGLFDPAMVAALGVTGQGETIIPLDAEGKPVHPAIVWLDNRATEEATEIAAEFTLDEVYRRTGQPDVVPTWTACKILWLKKNKPEAFAATARFLLVSDYIIYRLTGTFVSDHALNGSTLYHDMVRAEWWTEMLECIGVRRDQLPELRHSGHDPSPLTADVGLPKGIPVLTTPIDQVAAPLGAGNTGPGMITETTGTVLGIAATCAGPTYDVHRRAGIYRHAMSDYYVILPWVPTAGIILRWFRDELGCGRSFDELCEEASPIPPGSEGLVLLPHFSGAVTPVANPYARGVLYGLSLGHTRAHIVRAIMESVAFILRENIEILAQQGVGAREVCSMGGGASSTLWLQLKANVLNKRITTVNVSEASCLGAAIIAAVGCGHFAGFDEAVRTMVHPGAVLDPHAEEVAQYDRAYRRYERVNKVILSTFRGEYEQ